MAMHMDLVVIITKSRRLGLSGISNRVSNIGYLITGI